MDTLSFQGETNQGLTLHFNKNLPPSQGFVTKFILETQCREVLRVLACHFGLKAQV